MSSNTNLGPTPVNQGYVQLIHIGETGGIDGTLRTIYDGDGTASDLQIASNAVKISTTLYIGSQTILQYIQDAVKDILITNASHTNITATQDVTDKSIDLNATGAVSSIIGGTGINATGSGDITIAIDSTVVTLTGSQTLTNKTLTSPIISSISNTGTLTLPTSTDTLVGRATTDTLTNKTLTNPTINAPTINTSLTFDSVALTAIQTSAEAFADNDTSIMTSAAIDDRILSYGYSTTTGTVTSVSGGNGLTGTITSSGSLNVGAGTHITVNADDIAVNTTTLFASPTFTGTTNAANLTLSGNLIVNGTTITIDTDTLAVQDPLIKLAKANSASDTVDIGFYGLYDTSGSQDLYAGLFRDADDSGKFKLFKDLQVEPTSTVNVLGTGYTTGTLVASLEGNASTATALATARGISMSGEVSSGSVNFDGTASVVIPNTTIGAGVIVDGNIDSAANIAITKLADYTISGVSLGGTLGALSLSSPLSFTSGTSYTGAVARTIQIDSTLINHDTLANYVANEHIDWTAASAGTIHSSNYINQATTFEIQDSGTPSNVTISQGKYVKFQALNNGGLDIQWASPLGAGSSGDPYDLQFQIDLGDLPAMAGSLSGSDNIAVYDSTEGTVLVTAQEIADLASAGLTYNGSTANGVLTYGSSTTIDVEQYITFTGGILSIGNNDVNEGGQINLLPGTGHTSTYQIDNFYGHLRFFSSATAGEQMALTSDGNLSILTGTKFSLDGRGGHTYIQEESDGNIVFYADNRQMLRLHEGNGEVVINDPGLDTNFRVEGDTDSNLLFVDAGTDRVGIGTASPNTLLHLYSTSNTQLRLQTTGTANSSNIIYQNGSASYSVGINSAEQFSFYSSQLGSDAGFINTNGWLYWYNPILLTTNNTALKGRDSGGNVRDMLKIDANNDLVIGDSNLNDVYINQNVGIGTTSPSAKLEVNGTSNFTGEMYIDHGGSGYSPGISFMGGTNIPGSNTYENAQLAYYDNAGTGYFRSRIGRWGGDFRWIIGDAGGDVTCATLSKTGLGIGTTSPSANLHIYEAYPAVPELRVDNSNHTMKIQANGTASVIDSTATNTLIVRSSGTTRMTIDNLGDVKIEESLGIGVAASSTTGRLDCSNDVVAYSTSDKRLKENIKPLENSLDKVLKISGVEFDWKPLNEEEKETIHGNEGHDVGVIAQEIEEVLPEVVTTRDTGYKAVKYEKIVPLLIEAIKEQQQQINELKEKLNG